MSAIAYYRLETCVHVDCGWTAQFQTYISLPLDCHVKTNAGIPNLLFIGMKNWTLDELLEYRFQL